jgi:hypothetical protein
VLARLAALTPRQRTLVAVGVLLLVIALPLRGLLRRQGPPMEEGFMLVFAEQFLHGMVPNRDFLHLYGPGGVWVLAGVFKVFGVSLLTERLVGLVQLLGIIFGIFCLVLRPWGRTLALVAGGITALIILPPIGLAALAWNGAVAFALFGIVAGIGALRARTTRGANGLALTSGTLFGLAVLYRPDVIIGVALVVAFLVPRLVRSTRRRLLGAAAAVTSLFVVQIAMAGLHNSVQGMILDPVFNLRGGRHLPLPPSWHAFDGFLIATGDNDAIRWPIPHLWSPAELTIWFFLLLAGVGLMVGVAWWRRRRAPTDLRSLTLLLVAALSVGILPQALQRPDTTHLAWVSCVPFGFFPVVVYELVRARRPNLGWVRAVTLAVAPIAVILYLVIPNFMVRDYADLSAQTFDIHRKSFAIHHDGRLFYYGRQDVTQVLAELLPLADRISKPGDRLIVATGDLRKTPYSDAFLYYMLPKLVPATYYIEMDPGVANAKDSRLANELKHADVVILSRVWDNWVEPNDSRVFGPETPNQVLKRDFCTVKDDKLYVLLHRCSHGDAPVP